MNAPRSVSDPGLLTHLLGLLAQALLYLQARAALAKLEAKAAGMQYGLAAAMVLGALFVAGLGYIFLIVSAVFAIGLAFHEEQAWVAVLGGTALLHLAGAAALIFSAKRKLAGAAFPETVAEIEKDRQWLQQLIPKR
jgi:uncharacterized membrane protein YqjE